MNKNSKIYIAGHNGLVGSAIVRYLKSNGYNNLLVVDKINLNLENQLAVNNFFYQNKPEYVFLAAAKVGGIQANNIYPAEFIYSNLAIQTNVIHACHIFGTRKLCFLGSSCIYAKECPQPIKEEYLLSGQLESTNEPYAIAKIAGIKMVQSYNRQYSFNGISLMPTNLFGVQDSFHLENSHVLPAMIHKFHYAKINNLPSITLWGTGTPRREFLYVDDLADAAVFLMNNYNSSEIINVGCGQDITIRELAEIIQDIVKYTGLIEWDASKPNGTKRKLLDTTKINNLGWYPQVSLIEGIQRTYRWFVENYHTIKK